MQLQICRLATFKNNFSFAPLVWKFAATPSGACLGIAQGQLQRTKAVRVSPRTAERVPKTKIVSRLNLCMSETSSFLEAIRRLFWAHTRAGISQRCVHNKDKAVNHETGVGQAVCLPGGAQNLWCFLDCRSLIIIKNSVLTILITREAEVHLWLFGSFQQSLSTIRRSELMSSWQWYSVYGPLIAPLLQSKELWASVAFCGVRAADRASAHPEGKEKKQGQKEKKKGQKEKKSQKMTELISRDGQMTPGSEHLNKC